MQHANNPAHGPKMMLRRTSAVGWRGEPALKDLVRQIRAEVPGLTCSDQQLTQIAEVMLGTAGLGGKQR